WSWPRFRFDQLMSLAWKVMLPLGLVNLTAVAVFAELRVMYDPTFEIYRLEPKGTLAQLATVWEFLIQLIHKRTEDFRPLTIYAQWPSTTAGIQRTTTGNAEARTDLIQHRIYLPEGWIDQITGEWHGANDAPRGVCRMLAPADGREALKLFSQPTIVEPT
ncbi:MAG: NADH-quinone oxidoreductase subunit H, partial [Gammaproteobacteria bacterium]